jgi:hypothetical protein
MSTHKDGRVGGLERYHGEIREREAGIGEGRDRIEPRVPDSSSDKRYIVGINYVNDVERYRDVLEERRTTHQARGTKRGWASKTAE